jgi:hypothetical protein
MEMMHIRRFGLPGLCLCICILLCSYNSLAQADVKYSVKNGSEVIELSKKLSDKQLDEFILNFDLSELDLKNFLKANKPDSLLKRGWLVAVNNEMMVVLTRPLFGLNLFDLLSEKIHFNPFEQTSNNTAAVRYGFNKFNKKYPFLEKDSLVIFYLRNNLKASTVLLAGNFTNWQEGALPMKRTDSGWIAYIKLGAGKYAYKFIVDGYWITDGDNQLNENDGEGNTNSVYYKTNVPFKLNGFTDAKKVYLAGSFNDWREKELLMTKIATGWELPVLLTEGTHTYKFIVDGNWIADAKNPERLPDGNGDYNSVLRLGNTHTFKLNGYTSADKIILSGSFNGWKEDELFMKKTATGWELPYTIGPGNYEYKFIVDGEWIADPGNQYKGNDGNSYLVISPNYTFKITAPDAKKVFLAGDFNGWNPASLPMIREGDTWTFNLFLAPGKHRYKFIVDGEWIKDPANKLWEENEYETGNSIVWIK